MSDLLIARLQDEMRKQGYNYKSLSRAAGLGETSVRDIITRRALNPRRDTLQKIAATLQKPLSYFLAENHEAMVRVAGELSPDMTLTQSSNRVSEHVVSAGEVEMVETPPELGYRNLVALRITGNSLLPFLPHGTFIYYNAAGDSPEECLDTLCVIQLKQGPVTLKILKRGMLYGTFHLQDYQGGSLENCEIEWCARVRFIKLT